MGQAVHFLLSRGMVVPWGFVGWFLTNFLEIMKSDSVSEFTIPPGLEEIRSNQHD